MNTLCRFGIAAVATTLLGAPAFAADSSASGKLDAALLAVAAQGEPQMIPTARRFRLEVRETGARVTTILRFTDSLDAVVAAGAVVRSVMGDIATVEIPVAQLGAVAALPGVVSIEAARPLVPRLDVSVPVTRADQLRKGVPGNWTAGTGKGVIVGIFDSGIDFRHRDFRHADGTTRMLALWDQSASASSAVPPSGPAYGRECSAQAINAAIAGDATACPQAVGYHGTHVAGIAAGSGQATGNGQIAWRMIGMAPDADLIGVNSKDESDDNDKNTAALLDGVAYLATQAEARGAPLVVNLSTGSYYGSRDGASNFEQGLDRLSRAGVVIVASAGNEADSPVRAAGTIAQGETVTVGFEVLANKSSGALELWYPGTNAYAISIGGPGCAATETVEAGAGARTFATACATIAVSSTGPQPNNDDRQILVKLTPAAGKTVLASGAWSLLLTGRTVAGGRSPFSIICSEDGKDLAFTSHTTKVTEEILTDTSSARRVVAVGAHNTRYSWTNLAGPYTRDPSFGPIGDLASFSSRGPRRACSNTAKCPPAMKPEIAAPGVMVLAAMGAGTESDFKPEAREADGVHGAKAGTSMAAPHVSGAVALLLQKQPDLTPEQVKALLFANVQTNAYAVGLPVYDPATPDLPANPNYAWGYGMLDAAKAAAALAAIPGANNFEGLWWKSPAGSESGWGINFAHQGDKIFATWFTYDAEGKPWWLIATLARTAPGIYAGEVATVTGPPFNAEPWDVTKVKETVVGTMKVVFATTNDATLTYTVKAVKSVTQSKAITRQVFGPVPACVWGAQPDLTKATNYQDLWWNAPAGSENGWGINLTQQGDVVFATWFTYDVAGKPWWLAGTLRKTAAGTYAGPLATTTGPPFNAVPFDPAKVVETPVGTATLTFADGNRGSFAYVVNGVAQTKAITRQVFAAPGTVCH